MHSTTSLPRGLKHWIGHPFSGKLSLELRRTLQPFGFRPAFYNSITLRNVFVNLKDCTASNERSGVMILADIMLFEGSDQMMDNVINE